MMNNNFYDNDNDNDYNAITYVFIVFVFACFKWFKSEYTNNTLYTYEHR